MVPRFGRLLCLVASLAMPPAAAHASPGPPPLKTWRDGPARLLLKDDEYQKFGAIKTDDERRSFIDAFWKGLAAAPDAGGRDFRADFEERAAVAAQRFSTIEQSGWNTVRGRVYILLGEPETIRLESGGMKAVEKEVWVYPSSPGAQGGLEVAFYRCGDGTYRTDPACDPVHDTSSVSFDWERHDTLRSLRLLHPDVSFEGLEHMLIETLASLPRESTPSSLTSNSPAAKDDAGATPSADDALDVEPYYFRAQDGTVLVFLTLEMHDDDPAAQAGRYLAAASFERVDGRGAKVRGAAVHTTPLDRVARDGRAPIFFGRAYLEPGRTYAARYALRDETRNELLVRRGELTVPDLSTGLAASSLVLAEQFGPAHDGSERYRIGSEEVVPRVGATFRRNELLRVYLQVYGAALDPEKHAARVDVVYRFERVVDGTRKKFRKPYSVREAAGAAMGLALPIGDWPAGPYRVRVDLHDRVSGERVSADGAFTVIE
ncbi:MAG TPA: GWxTD domain-containing protein [Candidatus Polarisedimenticolaceae bacterium]|nr:GWxTD domain-containing protein [Candidatus Polarisedimenticolaceae bacterium]